MNAEGNRLNDELLVDIMQPIPAEISSSESSSSESDGSTSSSDSEHQNISDDEDDDPLDVMDYNVGGPAEEDVLFPFMQILMRGRRRANVQDFLVTVHRKSNDEFRRAFRLSRRLAYRMIDQLSNSGYIPHHNFGKPKKSAEVSFLMFLWYVSNEEPLRILGEIFDMSESSVFRIIRRVVDWLMTLLDDTIKWPEGDEVFSTARDFAAPRGIQRCIGAVDGCHIRIIKPCVANANDYFCRKKYFSINLTAIVNAKRKFTMVYCGDPGSFHDTRVFRRSNFVQIAERHPEQLFPPHYFIIGDGGYQGINDTWLVHPYRENGHLTEDQREFNRMISSTRVFVEQAFGILKGRFRRLLHEIHLFDIPFAVDLIIACCILHNLCIGDGDEGDDMIEDNWFVDQPPNNPVDRGGNQVEITTRERLFRDIFGYYNDGWEDGIDPDDPGEAGGAE